MRPLRPASVGVTSASPGGAKPGRGPRSLNSGSPEAVCFLDIGDTCGEGREARGGSGSRGREAGGGAGGKPAGKRSRGRAGRGSPTEMFDFVRRVRGRGRGLRAVDAGSEFRRERERRTHVFREPGDVDGRRTAGDLDGEPL